MSSYQGQQCFGKNDLEEARELLLEEYGAKGKVLYIAVEEKVEQEGVVCEPTIEEWQKYLDENFDDEELKNIAVTRLEPSEAHFFGAFE